MGVLENIMYLGDIVSSFLVVYGFLFPNFSILGCLDGKLRLGVRTSTNVCYIFTMYLELTYIEIQSLYISTHTKLSINPRGIGVTEDEFALLPERTTNVVFSH